MFNKLADPESVVRESEFERTGQSLSFRNQLLGKWSRLAKGGAGLTNPDREAIFEMAEVFSDVFKRKLTDRRTQFSKFLTSAELNPEDFLRLDPALQDAPLVTAQEQVPGGEIDLNQFE